MPESRKLTEQELAKVEAETAKVKAETEAATVAATAEAEKVRAEGRKFAAEAEEVELRLGKARHESDREDEKRKKELAGHEYHHVYPFNGAITGDSVAKCMAQLTQWNRNDPGCDIEIIFNSPGGEIVNGMALWDYIKFLQANGHRVTTSTIGYAASMAGILLEAGDVRIMGRESWLMIHEASFGAQGKIGDVEDTVKWVNMVQDRILDIFAAGCKRADNAPKRLTRTQIKNKWRRQNWWISSDDALAYGLVDEIR